MALTTVASAKTAIPSLSADSTTDDAVITDLIAVVGHAFARYTGYPGTSPTMQSASYTRDFDGDGTRDLTLDVWPVTAITSIRVDPTLDFTDDTYLLDSGDYVLLNSRTVRLKSTAAVQAFASGTGNVRIAFTAGLGSVPDDLARLANLAVRAAYDLSSHQGKTSVSQGGVSIGLTDPSWLPAEVRQGLATYRLPRVWL